MLTHDVAVEQGDGTPADLQQLNQKRVSDGGFARARQPCEEDREALLVARWVRESQLAYYLGEGKPFGDVLPCGEAAAQLRAGDVERARAFGNLVTRDVGGHLFDVDHHLEGNHADL